ncbi:MAG: dicarboxylate/amino acid:cation symporter [Clostridiaceae bacterium]|uniref:Dicarboxylate/amino acid:cation symporter n=1 Tax=Clostridium porci TaxID=2605778 RepID=A0A7X2TCH4_9CLOT|nr:MULTISPECIES: dicarboxylate/amino acid:cation symporter [Clostridium]MCI6126091.1 dicarboxylate/amino acid:cation symporter [Enterocloster clostridioformis]MCI6140348.1 dicarboxylate/amino acid:cation symporter [Clostridium sp.]MDY3230196.1 dicarboxylate/amino acid:cation symporter [Clostridiaceae bacterium]MSS36128.1 dicarboxylate/amino acid:cation symporter [Clostridium porci]
MRERKKIGLTTAIFIGLFLGAATGILFHYVVPAGKIRDDVFINGVFYVVGNGFLRLMQMLVVPLVFSSLVCGSMAMGDTKKLGKIGVKTLGLYLVTTALAITVAILTANVINPGVGLNMTSIQAAEVTIAEKTSLADTLLNIIPTNPIKALADGEMLQVILFALIVGVILAGLSESAETVGSFFSQFNDVMMQMTVMVMKLAPYGVFCLIAKTFSGIGFNAFLPLFKYMAGVIIALAIQCCFIYMIMLKGFTGLSPVKFLKKFLPVMGFAFSTATSNATIPMSIDTLDKKMGVSKRISSFTIPLGATINMDGTAIMQGVAVVFAAQAFGIHLTLSDYMTVILTATLASVGTAGVPGVGLITLSMVFASVGLPVEAIALIMGIDRILDMSRTAVNITGDAVCTTIVAYQDKAVKRETFNDPAAGLNAEN